MEEKKFIVTKVTKMDKQDSYGNYSYVIETSCGDKGFYTTKEADQKKFVVNEEQTYCIEEKTGSTGKKYFKITLPKVEGQQFTKGGGSKFTPPDPKIQFVGFAMRYVVDMVVADKIKVADLEKQFDSVYSKMLSKV